MTVFVLFLLVVAVLGGILRATDLQWMTPKTLPKAQVIHLGNLVATDLTALPIVELMLYRTNVTWTRDTNIGSLTEANFGGYARSLLTVFTGGNLDSNGVTWVNSPLVTFTATGASSNEVFGAAIVASNGGTRATATATVDGGGAINSTTITLAGTKYESPPTVTIAGAPGVGFVGHTVLSGDGVLSIVIDTPGSGYVAPVVTIGRPESIVCGGPFPAPVLVSLATDIIPIVPQVPIPPISV